MPPKIRRFLLLVGYNIQPSSSSTNQNAALIIDYYLDFTKYHGGKLLPIHSLKWNSNNLQSDQQGSCQRICELVMRITSKTIDQRSNMAVEGGTVSHQVSHYYILVIRKFIDLMSLFRQCVVFFFLLNNFPLQSLEYAT